MVGMIRLCGFLLTLYGVSYAKSGIKECKLPPAEDIDWSKMKGHWRGFLDNDKTIEKKYPCPGISGIIPEKGGFGADLLEMSSTGHMEKGRYRTYETADGYYREYFPPGGDFSPKDIKKIIQDNAVVGLKNGGAMSNKIAFYTDYDNYLLALECDVKGKMSIWSLVPHNSPTAADVLRVTNKLAQIGGGWNDVKLYLIKCVKPQPPVHPSPTKCKLPPPQEIDWSKMKGSWVGVFDNDERGKNEYTCLGLGGFTPIDGGFTAAMISSTRSGENEVSQFSAARSADGYYCEIFEPDNFTSEDLARLEREHIASAGKKKGAVSNDIAFYTDYDTYLLSLECDTTGKMIVWGLTRSANPTAGDVLAATKALDKIGNGWNDFKLYLKLCLPQTLPAIQ